MLPKSVNVLIFYTKPLSSSWKIGIFYEDYVWHVFLLHSSTSSETYVKMSYKLFHLAAMFEYYNSL